ncbi:MAG: nucleotidyltransferase family protein [Clostridia bacterium]|nr:nucleotidyltransferase family protein [Clostridia bacterium]
MEICAIIAEYNPFHKGHLNQINLAKKLSGCEKIVCFLSQNFSQRGLPTILDKKTRSLMAISCGADAVLELPTALTTLNAELFAKFMIKSILSFKEIKYVCFGSECGDINLILEVAKFLNSEPQFFKEVLKNFLDLGYSLNLAKSKALEFCIDKNLISFGDNSAAKTLLKYPNNILAVEYAKILLKQKSKITPLTYKRTDDFSASKIREILYETKDEKSIEKYIPKNAYNLIKAKTNFPDTKLFDNLLLSSLKTIKKENLKNIFDVSEGLENKIKNEAQNAISFDEFLENVCQKRYTKNRIRRIALHALLNIDKNIIKKAQKLAYPPYLKIVALKKDKELLNSLSKTKTNLVLRKCDADKLKTTSLAQILNEIDNTANSIYSLLTFEKQTKNNLYEKTMFI